MNVFRIMAVYPIGTIVRVKDDYPGNTHEVYGYEWFGDSGNIIFRDGTKLNMRRLELIEEVFHHNGRN